MLFDQKCSAGVSVLKWLVTYVYVQNIYLKTDFVLVDFEETAS